MDSHDNNLFNKVIGQTDRFACDYLCKALKEIDNRSSSLASVWKLHSSHDSNRQLTLITMGYKGRDYDTKTLSYSTVRDLQGLGHLGLGKRAYWELVMIHLRDGVVFQLEV